MLQKTFITSDFHFNHANIIKYCRRPFASVEEMNRELVKRYNSRVSDMDTVYVLGDITMGSDLSLAKKLRGKKKLLLGNHDKLPLEAYEAAGFDVIRQGGKKAVEFTLDGFKLMHSPMAVIRTFVPDMIDRPEGYRELLESGMIELFDRKCVCGHVHAIFRKMGCFVNVSVDVWDFYPAELDELGKEISDRVYKETNGGIKILGACAVGTRTLWLRSKNMIIKTPADMAPIKLRMPNSAVWLLLGRSLGAQPTPLDGNETYLALQTGSIDGQENAIMAAYNAKFQEVCQTICRTDHLLAGNTIALHGGTWRNMTPEQQELFVELMREAIALQVSRVVAEEERIMAEVEAKGMIMQTPDRQAFRKHVQDFYLNDPVSKSWDMTLFDKVNALLR